MCLISKYLRCLKLCVYYYNKTTDRSCIHVYIIYKVCFTLLYVFLFHLIKFTFKDFVNIALGVLKKEKSSRNRPDVAQSVPGALGSQIFMTFDI